MSNVSVMTGLTMRSVRRVGGPLPDGAEVDDEIHFESTDGRHFIMRHDQDCRERVTIDDIAGDLEDLVGSPLILSEEVSSADMGYTAPKEGWEESFTWTFYRFATAKGYVTIRWYGSSNGYYSESIDFVELDKEGSA